MENPGIGTGNPGQGIHMVAIETLITAKGMELFIFLDPNSP